MDYDDLVRGLLATDPAGCWQLVPGDYWCRVSPSRSHTRAQGWKIHVSAVPADAEEVLRRTGGALIARSVPFKYVGTAELLRASLGRQNDPSASGKFLTVYPATDEQFTRLLDELHSLLAGLRGPRILSDRQYRGGLVHYRYGAFTGHSRLDDHGVRQELILAPDGSLTPDLRRGWYTPPAWARDPVARRPEDAPPAEAPGQQAQQVQQAQQADTTDEAMAHQPTGTDEATIGGRYRVTATIRHTNRGGVHRAVDTRTGRPVVIKHCRAWVEPQPDGTDTRDLMRHEAAMLARLAGAVPVPELVDLLELGDNLFLVESELPGRPLRELLFPAEDDAEPLAEESVVELAVQLIELLRAAHRHGVVIGDVTPDNFLLAPDGRLRLIDLEGAAETGTPIARLTTKGYAPPEKLTADPRAVLLADEAMDRYAAGAILESLGLQRPRAAGTGERPTGAPSALDLLAGRSRAARRLAPAVRGLTAADPARRWSWERALRCLRPAAGTGARAVPADAPGPSGAPPGLDGDRLVHDALLSVLNALRPREAALTEPRGSNGRYDPRSVQAGAAGVTGVLLQARRALPRMPPDRAEALAGPLDDALVQVDRWWDRNLGAPGRRLLPGLYNGFAGACWAAADAALATDDPITLRHALDLSEQLPTRWHVPTIAHGVAGTGATLLHLWRSTGETALRDRARECALHLAETALPDGSGGLHWPGGTGGPTAYHGFAVGTAGIGWFLLTAADALGEPELTAVARRVGDGLVAAALTRAVPGDPSDAPALAAWWPEGPDGGPRRHGWWAGPAGIGAFLLELGRRTGEQSHADTARAAAVAVAHSAARAPLGAFWGLAGDGQFLLDAGADRAADLCTALIGSHAGLDERGALTLGDKHDFAAGVPGLLAHLLRHRYGTPAPWLLPSPALPSSPAGER
ncbi:class IV lanthionine synthetase LanL [Kitasatospora sp. NPDC028055]|uniref:class IV lanthionine synthetase LanL n=1 Tax=Kitasatospora sp. NPDC028055 TaxID=3155653 RepID=UPI0033C70CC1